MEKKKNVPETLLATYLAYNFMKSQNKVLPAVTRNKKSHEDRKTVIDACMDIRITEFPPAHFTVTIKKVEKTTGKVANPKATTIGELVKSLA